MEIKLTKTGLLKLSEELKKAAELENGNSFKISTFVSNSAANPCGVELEIEKTTFVNENNKIFSSDSLFIIKLENK